VEGSAAENSRMVHAETADAVVGCWRGAHFAVVDSGWGPSGQFLSMIGNTPVLPVLLAWAVVLVVLVLLCADAESRDYLLGHGKVLRRDKCKLTARRTGNDDAGLAVTS